MKHVVAAVFFFITVAAQAATITLPKRADSSLYISDASAVLAPGDTVLLQGDYKLINIKGISGTAAAPIVFINQGLVTVGGYASYTTVFFGAHFKILGNGDSSLAYGIKLGKPELLGAFGIGLGNSTNVEVGFCEMQFLHAGFLQNPAAGGAMDSCYYHDNYIHDLDNPPAAGRSEAFYLGNSKFSTAFFTNCRIENNVIENVSGDGIQVSLGMFRIAGNHIRNYAKASLAQQRSGIQIGGQATADVYDNLIEGGGGVGLQVLGRGNMEIAGNVFQDIDVRHLSKEDIVYINGKTASPDTLLTVNFHDNEFINVAPSRKIVFNATADVKTGGAVFTKNKGLQLSQAILAKKDTWTF